MRVLERLGLDLEPIQINYVTRMLFRCLLSCKADLNNPWAVFLENSCHNTLSIALSLASLLENP